MKREIMQYVHVEQCCPGHDSYPSDTFKSRRSKKARAKSKQKEHKYARSLRKEFLRRELAFLNDND